LLTNVRLAATNNLVKGIREVEPASAVAVHGCAAPVRPCVSVPARMRTKKRAA
jgi:hypothetical protein